MPIAVALRFVCRKGSATLTTVPSMKAMLEARIVAASTQRPISVIRGYPWLKRFVYRCALLREKLRPGFRDIQTVFETNAKLAVDHDRGFVAEAHAGLNRSLVAAHEVGPFVPVESDAVAGAMR